MVLVSIRWGLHVVNRTRTSCYFSWKRCWLVFSYHGEFSRFQVSKYIEYSAYTGCISLYIYCLITCNIKSLLNVPKISHISRKISQVSRFPAKSPDSRNKFVFLPKQPLLELSAPVKANRTHLKQQRLFKEWNTLHVFLQTPGYVTSGGGGGGTPL